MANVILMQVARFHGRSFLEPSVACSGTQRCVLGRFCCSSSSGIISSPIMHAWRDAHYHVDGIVLVLYGQHQSYIETDFYFVMPPS